MVSFNFVNRYHADLRLRTVLAGGERIQYSQESITGQSMLHYVETPSTWGKTLLNQQFVYYPKEFRSIQPLVALILSITGGASAALLPTEST